MPRSRRVLDELVLLQGDWIALGPSSSAAWHIPTIRGEKQEARTNADCQTEEVVVVKKIHDLKFETDVLGVGRGRRPTQYLMCSHPPFIRG